MSHFSSSRPHRHSGRALRGSTWGRLALWLALIAAIAATSPGCALFRGAVNASPALRWWLFSNFGAQRVCPEMLKRGAALKLTPGGNSIGRFFPDRCQTEIHDVTKSMTIHFGGTGYAWTPLAGRIGFAASASVEYRFDFRMLDDAVYVWARFARVVKPLEFKVGSVENKLVDWATRTPAGYLANEFGAQIMQSQLASGFTVVRTDEGDEFTIGILQPPQRPKRPFDTDDSRYVFANETTEVHFGQVDFLGPFEVADQDQALFLRFRLQGPAVDALVLHRGTGDLWRDGLQLGAQLGPPPQPPIMEFPIQPGVELRRRVKLARGQYYVVIDNSNRVGTVGPPWNPLSPIGANVATVSYSAELGDDDDGF
jgi:hypothetical protein